MVPELTNNCQRKGNSVEIRQKKWQIAPKEQSESLKDTLHLHLPLNYEMHLPKNPFLNFQSAP